MPAKSPREAVDAFTHRLRQITGCITDRPLLATGFRPLPRPLFVSFVPVDDPVSLRIEHRARGVALFIRRDYVIDRSGGGRTPYDVRTISYRYHIVDRQRRELLAYHWHPDGVSPVTIPHLHLSSRINPIEIGPDLEPVAVAAMHLPTGPVALADIVWLLITEFGVEPRRRDWADILERNRDLPLGRTVS